MKGRNDGCVCVLWGFGTTVNVGGVACAGCDCVYGGVTGDRTKGRETVEEDG